ncbi:MAG: thioredoxin domain-containing protein [Anaerosomatales bacterium]
MADEQKPRTGEQVNPVQDEAPAAPSPRGKALIVLGVALVFVVLIGWRLVDGMQAGQPAGAPGEGSPAASASDPVSAYEAALSAGKPIYVMFHSSTCPSCVEIEAAASRVLPDYSDTITFVDVYTDDPRARPLLSRFSFQYIPTSFFLAPDGAVVDQHTGVLDDDGMRDRLDALLGAGENG